MARVSREKNRQNNEFKPIILTRYLAASRIIPSVVGWLLRHRYSRLSLKSASDGIPVIWDNQFSEWLLLADRLACADARLAKSIYITLLRVGNVRAWKYSVTTENINDIAKELYRLEQVFPETTDEGKLSVFRALMQFSSPELPFWEEALEKAYKLANRIAPLRHHYFDVIVHAAFYAPEGDLQKEILSSLRMHINAPKLFEEKPSPERSKILLLSNYLLDFGMEAKKAYFRNRFFSEDPNANLTKLIRSTIETIVSSELEKNSTLGLYALQIAIVSNNTDLANEAAQLYERHFSQIAAQDPEGAAAMLREIAGRCHFNEIALNVFDLSIEKLFDIDEGIAKSAFSPFVGSHGRFPERLRQKYAHRI